MYIKSAVLVFAADMHTKMFTSNQLRAAIKAAGLTNERLAKESGVGLRTVERYQEQGGFVKGHQRLKDALASKLAEYGIDVADMLDNDLPKIVAANTINTILPPPDAAGLRLYKVLWIDPQGQPLPLPENDGDPRQLTDLELTVVVNLRCVKLAVYEGRGYLYLTPRTLTSQQIAALNGAAQFWVGPVMMVDPEDAMQEHYPSLGSLLQALRPNPAMLTGNLPGTLISRQLPTNRVFKSMFDGHTALRETLRAWQDVGGRRGDTLFHALTQIGSLARTYIVRQNHDYAYLLDYVGSGHNIFWPSDLENLQGMRIDKVPDRNLGNWMVGELNRFFQGDSPELRTCSGIIHTSDGPERRDWYRLALPLETDGGNEPSAIVLTLPHKA